MLEWFGDELLKKSKAALAVATEEGAEIVLKDAQRNLKKGAKKFTGHLAGEIEVVKSKFNDETYLVYGQPPGGWTPPYHAIFVELGIPGKVSAVPHLRPALKSNKRRIERLYEGRLK